MLEVIRFLAPPFVACVVLVAILGWFGLHVLLRGVIFVDLAIAQIAALGTLVGFVLHHEPGSPGAYAYSLGAALLGAAVFSLSRTKRRGVPQEAIIGITYVVASALAIVVADRAPEGAEHVKELLAGSIVWVTWRTVWLNLVIAAGVGAFHFALRRRFMRVSEDPQGALGDGWRIAWWDFLFYGSFAIVVTFAVEIAGVLLVFAFLVAPAMLALAGSSSWPVRLAIVWTIGVGASAAGMFASYRWDLPSGPAVVVVLAAVLLVRAAWGFATAPRRGEAPPDRATT